MSIPPELICALNVQVQAFKQNLTQIKTAESIAAAREQIKAFIEIAAKYTKCMTIEKMAGTWKIINQTNRELEILAATQSQIVPNQSSSRWSFSWGKTALKVVAAAAGVVAVGMTLYANRYRILFTGLAIGIPYAMVKTGLYDHIMKTQLVEDLKEQVYNKFHPGLGIPQAVGLDFIDEQHDRQFYERIEQQQLNRLQMEHSDPSIEGQQLEQLQALMGSPSAERVLT